MGSKFQSTMMTFFDAVLHFTRVYSRPNLAFPTHYHQMAFLLYESASYCVLQYTGFIGREEGKYVVVNNIPSLFTYKTVFTIIIYNKVSYNTEGLQFNRILMLSGEIYDMYSDGTSTCKADIDTQMAALQQELRSIVRKSYAGTLFL